jgi:hypothetical protein
MLPLIWSRLEVDESDVDESDSEPTASILETKIENDDGRTNPYASESLPDTATMDDAEDSVDCIVKATVREGAEEPEAKRRLTCGEPRRYERPTSKCVKLQSIKQLDDQRCMRTLGDDTSVGVDNG